MPMETSVKTTKRAAGENTSCDVLVIGGGPAGSTAAALLAKRGHDVLLLDKDAHPRFHIGESLLPANLRLFERLGVAEEMARIGMPKWAAEFHSPRHNHLEAFQFADAWDKNMPHSYEVRRSEFDDILLQHARHCGARVIEQCRVTDIDLEATPERAHASARRADGSTLHCAARFIVDASGRDTFLSSRMKLKQKDRKHNGVAVFGHFSDVRRHPGRDAGNITIYWFEYGWFWFIPLRDGITSIGMVIWPHVMKTRGDRSLEQFLMDCIALTPALAERMQDAQLVREVEATGNYSYTSTRNHGRNYVLIGDAYSFIDPVFSSGVMMAMQGGFSATDAIHTWLADPRAGAAALRQLDKTLRHGPRQFSWFIYRMSNPIMRDLFMAPRNVLRVKEALLSVLAGDIYERTPIWPSLAIFKGIYYLNCLFNLPRALRARRKRRYDISSVGATN